MTHQTPTSWNPAVMVAGLQGLDEEMLWAIRASSWSSCWAALVAGLLALLRSGAGKGAASVRLCGPLASHSFLRDGGAPGWSFNTWITGLRQIQCCERNAFGAVGRCCQLHPAAATCFQFWPSAASIWRGRGNTAHPSAAAPAGSGPDDGDGGTRGCSRWPSRGLIRRRVALWREAGRIIRVWRCFLEGLERVAILQGHWHREEGALAKDEVPSWRARSSSGSLLAVTW